MGSFAAWQLRQSQTLSRKGSLATDTVVIAVQMTCASRFASPNRSSPCCAGGGAVGIVNRPDFIAHWLIGRLIKGRTRPAMAVPTAVLSVVMAAICSQPATVRESRCSS